jgi:hypothetical protein
LEFWSFATAKWKNFALENLKVFSDFLLLAGLGWQAH